MEAAAPVPEEIEIRFHGNPINPVLVYLPGIHGDWTLIATFRKLISQKFYFIEFTYPRSLSWNLTDCAHAVDLTETWIGAREFEKRTSAEKAVEAR